MFKNILIYPIVIGVVVIALNYFASQTEEQFWAAQMSPDREWVILLYKEPQPLHHAPDIVIYQQRKGSSERQYIHHIKLPEDDRVALEYDIQWRDNREAVFSILCETCMSEIRSFAIGLGPQPTLYVIQRVDNMDLLKDRSINADLDDDEFPL